MLWKAESAEVRYRKTEVSQDMWLLEVLLARAGVDALQGGPEHIVAAFQASQHTWDAPVHSNLMEREHK